MRMGESAAAERSLSGRPARAGRGDSGRGPGAPAPAFPLPIPLRGTPRRCQAQVAKTV